MKLPNTTTKQQEILKLLYRYRFLNRIQIQTLMHHKDYKTINVWLKDLREKEFVAWIYSDHFLEKSKPAVYYLGINGIRQLRALGDYPAEELRKRYRENERSDGFILRSKIIADSCIELAAKSSESVQYAWHTRADMTDQDSEFHFLTEQTDIDPQLYYQKAKSNKHITHYLLEVIDPTLPQHRLRKRLKNYVKYFADSEWEGEDEPVVARLVLPNTYLLIYAKRAIKRMLEDVWDEDDVHIEVTTVEKLQQHGVLDAIWETTRLKKASD